MKTEIQIFENAEFGQIRTMVMPDGQVGFVGKDVCDVLGYSKARNAIAMHVEEDDALKWGLTDSLGRTQQTTFINESGLYSLDRGVCPLGSDPLPAPTDPLPAPPLKGESRRAKGEGED